MKLVFFILMLFPIHLMSMNQTDEIDTLLQEIEAIGQSKNLGSKKISSTKCLPAPKINQQHNLATQTKTFNQYIDLITKSPSSVATYTELKNYIARCQELNDNELYHELNVEYNKRLLKLSTYFTHHKNIESYIRNETLSTNSNINSLAWNLQGTHIAAGTDDHLVHIWDILSMQNYVLSGHSEKVMSIAWNCKEQLASGSYDGTVCIWNPVNKTKLFSLDHANKVRSIAWHPHGEKLASTDFDNIIRIWNTQTGTSLQKFPSNEYEIDFITWHPDGNRLAISYFDPGTIIMRNIETQQDTMLFDTTSQPLNAPAECIYAIAISPNGEYLAAASDRNLLYFFDIKTNKCIYTVTHNEQIRPLEAISWSPDSKYLVCSTDKGNIFIWNTYTHSIGPILQNAILPSETEDDEDMSTEIQVVWNPLNTCIAYGGDDKNIQLALLYPNARILSELRNHCTPEQLDNIIVPAIEAHTKKMPYKINLKMFSHIPQTLQQTIEANNRIYRNKPISHDTAHQEQQVIIPIIVNLSDQQLDEKLKVDEINTILSSDILTQENIEQLTHMRKTATKKPAEIVPEPIESIDNIDNSISQKSVLQTEPATQPVKKIIETNAAIKEPIVEESEIKKEPEEKTSIKTTDKPNSNPQSISSTAQPATAVSKNNSSFSKTLLKLLSCAGLSALIIGISLYIYYTQMIPTH